MKTYDIQFNANIISDETFDKFIEVLSKEYVVLAYSKTGPNTARVDTSGPRCSKAKLKMVWMVDKVYCVK